ncbi:hypothetical protein [Phytohabitans kaempferiae]|uniref:Uncharacterized protein n=1 Tax=Phytohabitans kaempferiae TaxID=1620943 RepID=A0ABV6ME78_9ACTN
MDEGTGLSAERIKHLELIQSVVARLANNSFLIKGWTLTVAAAFFALIANRQGWSTAVVGLVPLLVFWGLDAAFLRQERLFRRLYEDARTPDSPVEVLSMDVSRYRENVGWWHTVTSMTLLPFYGALAAVDLLLIAARLWVL